MAAQAEAGDWRALSSAACGMSIFPIVDALAKHLEDSLPVPQVLWARYVFQTVFLCPLVLYLVPSSRWAVVDYRRQMPQTLALMGAAGLYFAALHSISLATAATLFFLSPVYVIVLARVILKERPGARQWCAVGFGVLGATFILRPNGADGLQIGSILALCAGLANAIYLILVRRSRLSAPPLVTAAATAGIASVILSVLAPFVWRAPASTQWPELVLLGLVGSAAQFCVIFAFQSGAASRLAPLAFLELLSAMIISVFAFGDLPSAPQVIGAAIVLASVGLTMIG